MFVQLHQKSRETLKSLFTSVLLSAKTSEKLNATLHKQNTKQNSFSFSIEKTTAPNKKNKNKQRMFQFFPETINFKVSEESIAPLQCQKCFIHHIILL